MSIKESLIEIYKQQGRDPDTMPETTSGLIKVILSEDESAEEDAPVHQL